MEVIPLFVFDQATLKIIYTVNAVERPGVALNSSGSHARINSIDRTLSSIGGVSSWRFTIDV